eukprot:TRINITY_DN1435_c0_g1_i3.p1 TRINITY_DN1435_c0_g1~~TRINITY_DN1435_c0_g1_i3.p1  ORF type:complete len:114 (+),score=14.88 TRINITY_DN1435_c0_g1_i3:128-469(+)
MNRFNPPYRFSQRIPLLLLLIFCLPIFNAEITVIDQYEISLGLTSQFGKSIAVISDLDGDGIHEIVVGAFSQNHIYVLWLNESGYIKHQQPIAENTLRAFFELKCLTFEGCSR